MKHVLLVCIVLCMTTPHVHALVHETTKVIQRPNDVVRWAALAFALIPFVRASCGDQWINVPACARTVQTRWAAALHPEHRTALRAHAYRFCRTSFFGLAVRNTVCPLLLPAQNTDRPSTVAALPPKPNEPLFHKIFRVYSCDTSECRKEKDALLRALRTQYEQNPIVFWDQCENTATQFFPSNNNICTPSGWLAKHMKQPSVQPSSTSRPRSERVFKKTPPPTIKQRRQEKRARAEKERAKCTEDLNDALPKDVPIGGDPKDTKITSAQQAYERIEHAKKQRNDCRNKGLIGYEEQYTQTIAAIVRQVQTLPPVQCNNATTPIPKIRSAAARKGKIIELRFLPGEEKAIVVYEKIWRTCPDPEYVRENVYRLYINGKYGPKKDTAKFVAHNLRKLDRVYNPLHQQEQTQKIESLTPQKAKEEVARIYQEISGKVERSAQIREQGTGKRTKPPLSIYDATKKQFFALYGRTRHVQFLFENSYRALFPGQTKPLDPKSL